MVRDRDLREGRKAWIRWLGDDSVPNDLKCRELHSLDSKGWSPLHYAARYYRYDILDAAKQVDGGQYTCSVTCIEDVHVLYIYMCVYISWALEVVPCIIIGWAVLYVLVCKHGSIQEIWKNVYTRV